MEIWSGLVGLFRIALFGLAHVWGGSIGAAILTLSLLVRVALLPLTLRAARRARHFAEAKKKLLPRVERLQRRWRADPVRLNAELAKLYRREGLRPVRDSGMFDGLLQLPFVLALYSVIRQGAGIAGRFLWIGDLARPDRLLALGAAGLAAAVALVSPGAGSATVTRLGAIASVVFTYLLLTRLAAGIGLYWAASSLVGVGQGLLLRRDARSR